MFRKIMALKEAYPIPAPSILIESLLHLLTMTISYLPLHLPSITILLSSHLILSTPLKTDRLQTAFGAICSDRVITTIGNKSSMIPTPSRGITGGDGLRCQGLSEYQSWVTGSGVF
jgi:hypothetical protein